MHAEAPAGGTGDRGESLAMLRQLRPILLADVLDAADEQRFLLLHAFEAHASHEGERLLGRIEHLEEMTAETGRGEAADQRVYLLERRQEVADHHELAVARQRLELREIVAP